MQRSDSDKDDVDALRGIQRGAYVLIFTICSITLIVKRDDIVKMWALQPTDRLQSLLQIVLFLCAIAVVIRWIAATAHEFQLWLRNLHYAFVKSHVYTAMLALAVFLGILLNLVYNIVAFTAAFSCYLLFNYWTQWVANEHFERAFVRTLAKIPSKNAVLDVLRDYWIRRPQLARIVTMMFVSQVAFALAFAGSYGGAHAKQLVMGAYTLTILDIVVGEAVLSKWRWSRDKALQTLVDQDESTT